MFENLPRSFEAVKDWTWAEFAPYYHELLESDITPENLNEWLSNVTRFSEVISETYSRLSVAHDANTADEEAEKRYFAYIEGVLPPAMIAGNEITKKLVASGLKPADFDVPLRNMKIQIEIFREANIPLFIEEQKLSTEYDKINGSQTVMWEGEEKTLPQLNVVLQDPDRAVREKAWRLIHSRWLQDREAFNDLWARTLEVRRQIAENAGEPDYRAYRWKQLQRFDYTPEDCVTFQKAIEVVAVPAAQRIMERRRQRLGLDTLRPWDMDVDTSGQAPLRPFSDTEVFNSKAEAIFNQVDPALGGYYREMRQRELLDLENRKNKTQGGYCTSFDIDHVPFILMNAVGMHDDVQTLMHEGGHAFHVFESASLPYTHQREVPIEFAEVASMSMELLSAPYFTQAQGGYYTEAEAARARIEHLESMILFWPYMAVVDAFQHWVHEDLEVAKDARNCDAKWSELWDRFRKGQDWSGLQAEKETGWHRKLHIFKIPFYYVEYGLAQLGAAQVWARSLENQAQAVANYRKGLALGGTRTLPELFSTAGARFAFDAGTLKQSVDLIEQTIEELEAVNV